MIQNRLKQIRKGLEIKQKAVCDMMQEKFPYFDEPLLSKMENDYCYPTEAQLEILAEIYGCMPRDLLQNKLK